MHNLTGVAYIVCRFLRRQAVKVPLRRFTKRKEVHHGQTRGLRAESPVALPSSGPPDGIAPSEEGIRKPEVPLHRAGRSARNGS